MEMLIVKSKIKEVVKDVNVSGDFAEALNEEAIKLVEKAKDRALANGRKTVRPSDL